MLEDGLASGSKGGLVVELVGESEGRLGSKVMVTNLQDR